jgi:hypothetical protein
MPRSPYASLWDRIMANIAEPENDQACWVWASQVDRWGYGRMNLYASGAYVKVMSHVAAWVLHRHAPATPAEFVQAYRAWVAGGLELDHLCVNPSCCNIDHLEPVTPQENSRRRGWLAR